MWRILRLWRICWRERMGSMCYKNVDERRAYHREYMRERRAWLREHHFCTECKTQDAYTLAGRGKCFDCAHRRRKTPIEYITAEKEKKYSNKGIDGFCYKCGCPVMQGETRWGGRPIKLCERCYSGTVQMAAKGRKTFREKNGRTWGQMQYDYLTKKRESDAMERSSPRNTL